LRKKQTISLHSAWKKDKIKVSQASMTTVRPLTLMLSSTTKLIQPRALARKMFYAKFFGRMLLSQPIMTVSTTQISTRATLPILHKLRSTQLRTKGRPTQVSQTSMCQNIFIKSHKPPIKHQLSLIKNLIPLSMRQHSPTESPRLPTKRKHPLTMRKYPLTKRKYLLTMRKYPLTMRKYHFTMRKYPLTKRKYLLTMKKYPLTMRKYHLTMRKYPLTMRKYYLKMSRRPLSKRNYPPMKSLSLHTMK